MALKVDTCCGCVELRIGSFIIAYFCLVSTLVSMFLFLAYFEELSVKLVVDLAVELSTAKCILFLILVFLFVYMVFDIVLLIGLHHDKRGYIMCYLGFATLIVVISSLACVITIIKVDISQIGSAIQMMPNIALQLYYLIVLRSYYYEIKESEREIPMIGKA